MKVKRHCSTWGGLIFLNSLCPSAVFWGAKILLLLELLYVLGWGFFHLKVLCFLFLQC